MSDVAPRSVWLLSLRKEVLLAHKNHHASECLEQQYARQVAQCSVRPLLRAMANCLHRRSRCSAFLTLPGGETFQRCMLCLRSSPVYGRQKTRMVALPCMLLLPQAVWTWRSCSCKLAWVSEMPTMMAGRHCTTRVQMGTMAWQGGSCTMAPSFTVVPTRAGNPSTSPRTRARRSSLASSLRRAPNYGRARRSGMRSSTSRRTLVRYGANTRRIDHLPTPKRGHPCACPTSISCSDRLCAVAPPHNGRRGRRSEGRRYDQCPTGASLVGV